ncbi:hypothetical protein PRIPAC_76754 [Pristionchus pacificus]|uniref:Uncharacterized protein n=1 Tax=Pristionchus pacificus TaxID=54126 RepID=A0A2A6CJD9_PRIPA|nr:hypothetical protein PRIPAC_76754 [Pristionchus pacificus]|eukprot:PDM78187.1 hypothetical protein PRIPAC_30766 [Pristionchus pacificus]
MGWVVLVVETPLAPDDVTSKSVNLTVFPLVYFLPLIDRSLHPEGGERADGIEREQRWEEVMKYQKYALWRNIRKTDFDVTSSGANGVSTTKITHPIFSALENPVSQSFGEIIFLPCASPCSILTQTASY